MEILDEIIETYNNCSCPLVIWIMKEWQKFKIQGKVVFDKYI
jgi:hypothetical protein